MGTGNPRPVLVFTKKDSKMVTRMDHDKFGNIPCTLKSYRPAWLKNKEVLGRDRNVCNNADGWHLIAVHILFEAVMAAAQQEDIELANESRDWTELDTDQMLPKGNTIWRSERYQQDTKVTSRTEGNTEGCQALSGIVLHWQSSRNPARHKGQKIKIDKQSENAHKTLY